MNPCHSSARVYHALVTPYPVLGYRSTDRYVVAMEKSFASEEHKRLQALLRQARTDAGLRQADLAQRLGMPQSFISKYESGERRLDLVELGQICEAIGLSLQELVKRFEEYEQ